MMRSARIELRLKGPILNMCELFGVSSPEKIQLTSLLSEFFSHGDHHPDGWGMAFFSGNEVSLEKQPVNSKKSPYLRERLKGAIESDSMIAHIRLATKGFVEYENTHPFVQKDVRGRNWTLAHNGTIFDSELLNPMFYVQSGHTDSERILCYFIKEINTLYQQIPCKEELSAEDRFRLADRIICSITKGNKVNLLLFDGELLYVHTNYRSSLYCRKEQTGILFSTKPLDLKDWKPVPMTTLLAFRRGKLVFKGTDHGHEYFDSASKTKHLYLDYAIL